MKSKKKDTHNFIFLLFLIPFFFLSTNTGFAASTGTTPILQQNGAGAALQDGDYVTESGWTHQYYIEVPSGLSRLRVQLFDRDIAGNHDFQAGTWNTSCVYTLYNPSGASVASYTATNGSTSGDNVWRNLYDTTSTPIPNGHWRLVVDMTGTGGDETNAYGIRADDGTESSSGTELNIYAYSFVPLGRMSSTLYPWVTSGCTVDFNDFDGEGANTISYASRTGAVSGSYLGSANLAWLNRPISFTNDFYSVEAGLWSATNALSGTNINNFYAGNYSAADPPPTSQPQANTFRIYLQRDGGGKPSKPVVTQKLSFVSGSNPPANGSTSRVRVEIVIYNPAAQAITFSSSNLVTANIPGGGVVYAGNPVVSAGGFVVSQPAIGGTGVITWNPGTVAAGATATLYYYVDVTPTSGGQRLPVTGTPGSNGTTATYVDETGHAATGTYTYGPLCGLAVTAGGPNIPTWAAVTCFEACASESQPTVEWHTGTEAGTVGYNLWRQDRETKEFTRVNPTLLPALANAAQGGVYRYADPGAFSNEPVVYQLEEIDAQGRSMSYGPFTVRFGSYAPSRIDPAARLGKAEESDIYGYQRHGRGPSDYEQARLQARRLEQQQGTLLATAGSERARVTVKGRGLFYVTAGQIGRSLGLSEAAAASLISGYNLKLTTLGKDIAWLADSNGAGLFFYNQGQETVYSDKNIYFLEPGSGLAMQTLGRLKPGPAGEDQTYGETLKFAENHYFLPSLETNRLADDWFWHHVSAGAGGKTFVLDIPGASARGRATLKIILRGATDTEAANDHHALVKLNGKEIGSGYWDGGTDYALNIDFSASLLTEIANTVEVSGVLDMGAPYSIFYVDSIEVSYPRYYQAVNNVLLCRGDGHPVVTVIGMTEPQAIVLDVSTPSRPQLLTGVAVDVAGRLTFMPRNPEALHVVSGLNAALRPLAVTGARVSWLKSEVKAAEYIVIAPEEFAATAQELADYRRDRGLKTALVTLEDIYSEFSYGVTDPYALRKFLAYAKKNWGQVRYAVLAGKGTYDYNDYLGNGDNLVPAVLARSEYGFYAADKVYGDVTGDDGVPEIAIGRLPAVTKAELRAMIAKVKAYEGGQGAWTGKALFIADDSDDGGDFAQGSNELSGLTPGLSGEKIYLAGSAAETRARIIASWNAGAALVNYCGHAGVGQLAMENIFAVADAEALGNGEQLPLAVLLTCVAGRFELPGFTSLAETLLLNGGGGMAGGLVPSGAALHSDSLRLAEEFYKAAYLGQATSAGEALLAAMKSYIQRGGKASLLNVYNWLGDPALSFK